jgi:hypothetical protein
MLVAALALGSCQPGPPQDCKVAAEQAMRCMEVYRGKSNREMLLGCFPFSSPERIAGAWVTGFETNEFYEREQASPALIHKRVGDTELHIEGESAPATPTVFQMEFLGRRSQCATGFPRHIILLDRVISKKASTAS